MLARLHIGDALTNGLNNTSTLVSQNDGEGTFWVLARQGVGICVADTCVVNLDTDLVGLGRSNLDVLDGQVLAGFPSNGGLRAWVGQLVGARLAVRAFLRRVQQTLQVMV